MTGADSERAGWGRPVTQLVFECGDARALAGFWAQVLGLTELEADDDWVTLAWPQAGPGARISCHRVTDYRPPGWGDGTGAQQLHLDVLVDDLDAAVAGAVALGARPLSPVYRPDDAPWRVMLAPQGHPFCFVTTPQ